MGSYAGTSQVCNGNTFTVSTHKAPLALCAQSFTPFEKVTPLQIVPTTPQLPKAVGELFH